MMRSAATPRSSNHEAMRYASVIQLRSFPLSATDCAIMQTAAVIDKPASGSVPRHVPPDFGEVGFAGAGLIDELAVKHHHQTIR
jgi:hypothetical protein